MLRQSIEDASVLVAVAFIVGLIALWAVIIPSI
jgi:hypothetical protein